MKKNFLLVSLVLLAFTFNLYAGDENRVVFDGAENLPGNGKHLVFLAGDEEYRSEEMLTQMARIMAERHGFRCTVLYATNPETHEIDPVTIDNIPGLEALESADLLVVFLRFRNLPDDQMAFIVKYLEAGKPILGIRTATHAFNIPKNRKYAKYSFNYSGDGWDGGFGRKILGETWINHHGHHKVEATRGVIPAGEKHPITIGCHDIFGPSDVYKVRLPLPDDSQPVVLGAVLEGMKPTDKPVENEKNNPKMPILWTKTYQIENGKKGQAAASTIGSGLDFETPDVRRLLINACYWLLQMNDKILPENSVELVGEYKPLNFGFGQFRKGFKTSDIMQHKTPY
ncbi:MAG: ThuA domain-containing protein [Planctomycetaceae bacterium]|nr:ThuA domain-containing protein [Planctomycetaceae bacterium]